ncbi:MAG: hypothetical protein RL033_5035 [Pseudomonadota bacterium]|jgi:hypothetical protein
MYAPQTTHEINTRARRASTLAVASLALAALAACGDAGVDSTRLIPPSQGEAASEPGPLAAGAAGEPVYALVTLVWSDDGPTGYVLLSHSLDVQSPSLEQAREFAGYTSLGAIDGQLLVSPSAEDLTIQRFQISDELSWAQTGALSFANQGVSEVGFYRQYLGREHAAYLDVDVTGRVLWDPVDFAIQGTRPEQALPLQRDGLQLYANFNRTQFVFDGEISRPFSYHDDDWFVWGDETAIVSYDPDTNEVTKRIDAPCPGLDSITRDEQGNTYLGTWEYSALSPLMGFGAAPCAVRLTADGALDPSWNPALESQTDGRFVVNFRYIGGGKAIGAVLHTEEYGPNFDFRSLTEDTDDFWASVARYHRLWLFDVDAGSASPVQGIDDVEFVNPGFFHAVIDGRTFVFLTDGNSETTESTLVYELDVSGRATLRFKIPGSVTQWVRLR